MRSVRSIDEFSEEEGKEFFLTLAKVRRGMRESLGIEDVYLFQNEDTDHNFHLWIFPRHDWMEKFGRKIQSVRPIMEWATQHMTDEPTIREVKDAVEIMKIWRKKNLKK